MAVPDLVGSSAITRSLRAELESAARSDARVLITGESGVGKEVAARIIHAHGPRRARALATLNCAGLPESLLESELFGHVRGSFTDAHRDRPGLLQIAHTGTVFMDEVGEMSLRMQAMLLRFFETGEVQPVGSDRLLKVVDVRVITATNRDLAERVLSGDFREDLYYRLNVIRVHIPPLRERQEDVPELLDHFFDQFATQHRLPRPEISADARSRLLEYHWPGNIRELKNVVERLVVRRETGPVDVDDLPIDLQLTHVRRTATPGRDAAPAAGTPEAVARDLYERMVRHGASFWTAVYAPFALHDLTRETLKLIVTYGLERTQGRYSELVALFNMEAKDYKRFLNALKRHDCMVPYHAFRVARPPREAAGEADGPGDDELPRASAPGRPA